MKDIGLKLKNFTRKTGDFLTKHEITVYFSIILTVIFTTFWVSQEVSHAKEVLEVIRQNTLLSLAVDECEDALDEQYNLIVLQSETIQKYENTLEAAKGALNDQARLINDLVNYLKKIKHWPPKEPRPTDDPSKWITSEEEI